MWTSSLISRPASILIESNNKLRLPIGINLSASPLLKLLVPLALLVLLPAAPALAADITVGSGCTLVQAFNAAVEIPKGNTASTGSCATADTGSNASNRIILPANGSTTLTGRLDFSGSAVPDITIVGNKHTLSGDDKHRVIAVRNDHELTINNLIITNGHSGGDSSNTRDGGAISIQSGGVLNLNNSVVKDSYATGKGGGISDSNGANAASLTIKNSLISGNRAGISGGGISGGAIIVIENSAIVDNVSRSGGGIAYADFFGASLTIRNSTISGNRATGDGSLNTQHPTADRGGGGLDVQSGAATLIHVTMTGNTTAVGAALDDQTSSGFAATVKLRNSIIAGNTGGDCADGLNQIVNSIIEDGSCNVSNALAVDPKLGSRTGERPWYPLQAGSPAINAGHTDHCLTTDQRGRTRPQGSVCDMGAIEWYPPITVDSGCSLVQAIISANTDATASGSSCEAGFGADTIVLTGDVTLTALYSSTAYGLPSITTAITIEGKGYTVARSSAQNTLRFALFRVLSGGALILNDLTVSRGWNNAGGGGIFVANSHLTLNRSVISNNDSGSSSGGGIYVTDGTVSIRDSAIINNKGGLYIQSASVNVVNSTFSGNHCANASNGCGVYLATGTLTLTNVTIANNAGAGSGLRVVVASSVLKLRNSIIAGNSGGDCTLSSGATLSENVKSIIADGSCGATAVADVKLGALTGKPAYHPLLDGSPAIDAAASAHCPAADQRGQSRPAGSACDIGAYEYAPPATRIIVDSGCSLVQAIISANTDASASGSSCEAGFGADTIVLTGDVTLTAAYAGTTNGLPVITTPITIEGKGYTVARSSSAPAFRVFNIGTGGALTLNNVTITGGDGPGSGGGNIRVRYGSLTLNRSVISNGNTNAQGGGIAVVSGSVNINDSAIINNDNIGIHVSGGAVNFNNSTISGNSCDNASYGCGIYVTGGSLTLTHVTIANNTGTGSGLRVLFTSSVLKLRNSIIAGNSGGDCILSSGATLSENVNNIIQDGSCGATAVADVKLGALTGKPAYHPLLPGSPAIDAAASAHCPAADQRGLERPQGSACDIGAYEFPSPAAAKTDDATKPTTTRVSSSPSLPAVNSRFGKIGGAQWRGHFARLGIQAQDAAQQANWSIGDASVTGINYCFWDYECSTDAHWAYGHYHAAHGHNYLAPGSRPPLAADRSSDGRFNLCYSVWKNGCNSPEAWEFGWASGGEIYARWHRHRAGAAVKN